MKLTKKGAKFYLVKRVPERFFDIEKRKQVWISLRTDSEIEAKKRAVDAIRDLENQWVAALQGDAPNFARFDALSALAASRGYPYLPASEVAKLPLPNILARTAAAEESEPIADAVLGAVDAPELMLSSLVETYCGLMAVEVMEKSPDQRRIWENTVKRSVGRLITAVGDKPVNILGREDILAYRNFWVRKIEQDRMSPVSANRELSALSGIFSKLYKLKGLGDPLLFRNLMFPDDKKRRSPYSEQFIRAKLIPAIETNDLNSQAADIIRILINTGMRPSEVAGLVPEDIFLDVEVPYVAIRPRPGRELKTKTSIRDMPVVGIALDALRRNRSGFDRYRRCPSSLSATVNKFLRTQGLRPSPSHSLYSLRHGFQDRLTAVEAPDRVQADLMGHRYVRERYGVGPSLVQKAGWLNRIAFF